MQLSQSAALERASLDLHPLELRRARDERQDGDGMHVLIDRFWPRGLARDRVAADLWLRDLAPSERLLHWWGRVPNRWDGFAAKYRAELLQETDLLRLLDDLRQRGSLTLVYESSDPLRNGARILQNVLIDRDFLQDPQ